MRHTVMICLLASFVMLLLPAGAAERPVEDFTHVVIGEEFTATDCVYCPGASKNLYKIWEPKSEYPDEPYYADQLFYVAMIIDVNNKASDRANDYPDFIGTPTVYFDGGVTCENAAALREAGADILVSGSAIFGTEDPVAAARTIAGLE